jgi:ABC-2 type transport system permease protein
LSRVAFSGRRAGALLRKELRTTFGQPLFYVVGAVFLLLSGYYFYSDLGFFVEWAFGQSILRNFFELFFVDLRKVLMFTVPLLTMRLVAEERKLGTIELLFTYPLSDLEIVFAKLAACFLAVAALLAATTANVAHLYTVQPFPLAPVLVGYLGLALLGLCFVAIGLFFSSLTDNQVVASISTFGVLLFLWILTWNETGLGEVALSWLKRVSMFDHFDGFAVGLVALKDVFYFLSLVAVAAVATLVVLGARAWRGQRMAPTAVGLAGLVVALIFGDALAERWNVAIDLTPEGRHQLSPQAQRLLRGVDQDVEVTAFVRSGHPGNRAVLDLLEHVGEATPRVRSRILDLNRHPALAKEYGVDTYGAVAVATTRGRRVLGSPREDVLVGAIRELTREPPVIALAMTPRPESGRPDPRRLDRLRQRLDTAGDRVVVLDLDAPVSADVDALVVGAPGFEWTSARIRHLDEWVRAGGRVLALDDPTAGGELAGWLSTQGIAPQRDVVLDPDNRIAAGESVSIMAAPADAEAKTTPAAISSSLDRGVIVSLASSLELDAGAVPLLRTGDGSWATRDPSRARQGFAGPDPARDRIGAMVVAAARAWRPAGASRETRLVVVGDADVASDGFIDFLSNRDFLENSLRWLVDEEDLIGIRTRAREIGREQLFVSERQAWTALLLGVVVMPGASLAAAVLLLLRRRWGE